MIMISRLDGPFPEIAIQSSWSIFHASLFSCRLPISFLLIDLIYINAVCIIVINIYIYHTHTHKHKYLSFNSASYTKISGMDQLFEGSDCK